MPLSCLHFSCPKMLDRALYKSEADQLVPERGLVVVEPEARFQFFWGPLESRVHIYLKMRLKTYTTATYILLKFLTLEWEITETMAL